MSARPRRKAGRRLLWLIFTGAALAQTAAGAHPVKTTGEQQQFFSAIERGRIPEVEVLLKRGFNVNDPQGYGFDAGDSPLMKAAGQGNARMVAWLLRRGAQVNYRSPRDAETALFRAAKSADDKGVADRYVSDYGRTLSLLLEAGANPDLPDHNGQLPLYFARQAWTLKLLLAAGANPNAPTPRPPLIEHATDAERLRLLLAAGAEPNVRDVWGRSALHVAAGAASVESVRQLSRVMDPRTVRDTDKDGKTALDNAAEGGDDQIVRLLLAQGLPPTEAALRRSLERGHLRAARLQHQALLAPAWPRAEDLGAIDARVYTLILQNRHGQALVAHSAFEALACGRKTPLRTAVDLGNTEAVQALLALGVDVDHQAPAPLHSVPTAAHPLSSSGRPGMAYVLPPPCAETPVSPIAGGTALMAAVQRGDLVIARLLVAAGADPAVTSHYPPHLSARGWMTQRPGAASSAGWKKLLASE